MDASAFVVESLQALERAFGERGNDLRNAQLATVSPDGRPALRTVVLRGFNRAPAATIETHSDLRAAKVRDIAGQGWVALLAWSAAEQLQLRFAGRATLHHGDATARERWDKLSEGARQPYGLRADPGLPAAGPGDGSHLPGDERFAQFAVILVALESVDVLRLSPGGGQTRARGVFGAEGVSAEWIGA